MGLQAGIQAVDLRMMPIVDRFNGDAVLVMRATNARGLQRTPA